MSSRGTGLVHGAKPIQFNTAITTEYAKICTLYIEAELNMVLFSHRKGISFQNFKVLLQFNKCNFTLETLLPN